MISFKELNTWRDLLEVLKEASEEQLDQPVQCVETHPVDEHVHELQQGICIGTVDELELRYTRSVTDNRRHGEHLVIFLDYNPHAENGAIAYEGFFDDKNPIYPKDYDDSMNWTGPAQKLADAEERKKGHGTLGVQLVNSLKNMAKEEVVKSVKKNAK